MNTETFPKVGELWKYKEKTFLITEVSDTFVTIGNIRTKSLINSYDKDWFSENFKKVELETNETKILEKETSIENPSYSQQGKIQVWDFILDQNLGYLAGCIIKYLCRYKKKNGVENLTKAKVYLEKLIEVESKK